MSHLVVQISEDTELNAVHKINLPEEYYVENLNHGDVEFPLYFEIEINSNKIYTSVLEFTAAENTIEIPYFMTLAGHADSFLVKNDDLVNVQLIRNVIDCKSLTLEPMTEAFFEKEDYVSFLETELSKLSILYQNQIFYIFDDDMNNYPIKVIDIQPDEDVNFFHYNTRNQICYSILNQNIDTDIINQFERRRLIQQREKAFEKRERVQMQQEDILSKKLLSKISKPSEGRRISDTVSSNSTPTLDDIREARLRRFQKKK